MTAAVGLAATSLGDYPSETPSTRFPVYTRGNAGEVWPDVAYPLSISMSRIGESDPWATVALASGVVSEKDLVDGPTSFGGCFAGYMYLNLSFSRMLAIRTPGVSIEENDATFLGSEGLAPPHDEHPEDKNRLASLRALRYAWRSVRTTSLPELDHDRQLVEAWRRRLPELLAGDDQTLVAALRESTGPTMHLFARHLEISGKAGGAMQTLASFCERRLGDRELALTLTAGLGDVASAAPSFALWELGRMVAADASLGTLFDAGIDGLAPRLRADPGAVAFVAAFDEFLRSHGSRGPNEWETASDTWETDPALALVLVDRMRSADPSHDPTRLAGELRDRRERACASARDQLRWPLTRVFDVLVRAAALYSSARERTKTTVIDLIHVSRLVARELAGRVAAQTPDGTPEDLWFVLESELDDYLAAPAAFADTIRARRATRDELSQRVPPFVFAGAVPDPGRWPLRDGGDPPSAAEVGDTFRGLAGCPGVVEGRARVVLDPAAPGDIGLGDILVAPLTDPAWTPLFVPVDGVVVDVGGQMSHAVIVSRELGRPCVVAAADATRRIPDGARIRVDGATGEVTVLALP